ncbi:MAG: roadblock/LC7 domain-containing protein [Actinobacteria bacterium]|nr:roadblock/LC7 domain-containing protein [Actinomycetota bacterium]
MDEKDFAELISVFLKGSEQGKDAAEKEKGSADDAFDPESSSNEAEVRKNIIEALAERIKESQEAEEVAVNARSEAATMAPNTGISYEAAGVENPPETPGEETPEVEEELITKEEVDQLLSKEEPAEIVTLQQILHRFTALDGVIAALLVTRDGFVVDYASNIEFELDMVSAVVATGFGMLDRVGSELERGALSTAMLEYEEGTVVISPLVPDIALVIIASQWTTLGRIRWEIKKYGDELIANL